MPNLVVYVPAKMWARLEDELGAEFPAWARQMTVKHMQEFLDGRAGDASPEVRPPGITAFSRPQQDSGVKTDFKPVRK